MAVNRNKTQTLVGRFIGFISSFRYAIAGLVHAFKEHVSFRFQVVFGVATIIAGVLFEINRYEWMVLCVFIGLVLAAELLNTAIETTLDYLAKDHHVNVKVAKDVSAAGVFVLSISAVVAGLLIFIPHLLS